LINQPTDSDRLDNGDVYLQASAFYRNEERLVSQALVVATIPGAQLAAQVRPPLPNIRPFPPRFGYPEYASRQPGIDAVLDVPFSYRNRRSDISGGPAGWQASSRNVGNAGLF
jgi:hypothetical protein